MSEARDRQAETERGSEDRPEELGGPQDEEEEL